MILWLDAQLPPNLASWLKSTLSIEAVALRELGLRDASDRVIFDAARLANATLLSKDQDFVGLVRRLGAPPHLLWLTCGNASSARLQQILGQALPTALSLIAGGEPVVEILGQND